MPSLARRSRFLFIQTRNPCQIHCMPKGRAAGTARYSFSKSQRQMASTSPWNGNTRFSSSYLKFSNPPIADLTAADQGRLRSDLPRINEAGSEVKISTGEGRGAWHEHGLRRKRSSGSCGSSKSPWAKGLRWSRPVGSWGSRNRPTTGGRKNMAGCGWIKPNG